MRFALLAGVLGLLSSPHGSHAFSIRMSAAPKLGHHQSPQIPNSQQMPQQPAQPTQFYDANGNPIDTPMVYDANGNLVPFNLAAVQQQQQPPVQPKVETPPAPVAKEAKPFRDPMEDTVASVKTVLAMYKRAKTPAEKKGMVKILHGALMDALNETEEIIEKKGLESSSSAPPKAAAPAAPASHEPPKMEFPATYAVTKPEEEKKPAAPAQSAPVVASAPPKVLDADVQRRLETAASTMDAKTVTSLLESGAEMNEETTDAAFWAVVRAVDRAESLDQPLPAEVPQMLHHIFDADLRHLLTREQQRTNITCMQPTQEGINTIGMNYIFDDSAAMDLPLEEGRRCEDGNCCDACSRNIFPTFATDGELDFENTFQGLNSLTFNDLEKVSAATIIQFTRLIERVRRTIAHEYGLDLSTILPLQAYSRKYVAGTTQKGGGGGEGDFVILHTDEATHSGYHYSCVMYMSTHGKDFEGGDFVFNDPLPEGTEEEEWEHLPLEEQRRRTGRQLTPFSPVRGSAVIFSSGWENMHEVEKITSGTRYVVPCFFTTCPVPEQAYEQMHVGKPKTDEDIADDWLHLLLAHREETPIEAAGRVKELLMKWHYMCAPLSRH